jgi:hypothetical protein
MLKIKKNASGYNVINEENGLIYASVLLTKNKNCYNVSDHTGQNISFKSDVLAIETALKMAERNLKKVNILV